MTRAGKEPAEDVKRAFRRAIELAGLKVHRVEMFKTEGFTGRIILGSANPEGWPHKCPAMEMSTLVGFGGEIGRVDIRCAATDEDHLVSGFSARTVRNCSCELKDLPVTLKAVWAERQAIVDLVKQGKLTSAFVGHWTWEAPDMGI
jgi:hypothetical protein